MAFLMRIQNRPPFSIMGTFSLSGVSMYDSSGVKMKLKPWCFMLLTEMRSCGAPGTSCTRGSRRGIRFPFTSRTNPAIVPLPELLDLLLLNPAMVTVRFLLNVSNMSRRLMVAMDTVVPVSTMA